MATKLLCLARFWCSLSCRAMKLWYLASSNLMPLRMAHEKYWRTCWVSGLTVTSRSLPSAGALSLYWGTSCLPRKTLRFMAIPSKQSMSYLLAGISILS